jgi:hypothetical protein
LLLVKHGSIHAEEGRITACAGEKGRRIRESRVGVEGGRKGERREREKGRQGERRKRGREGEGLEGLMIVETVKE